MDFYNTEFYDKASKDYSNQRYNSISKSYIQFFFKRRLKIVLKFIEKEFARNTGIDKGEKLRLLESGCADGIVIDSIVQNFPNLFFECIGTDISSRMIETAKVKNKYSHISYCLKNTEESGLFDLILAVGFVSAGILEDEFNYIKKYLNKNGVIIISLASRKSLYTILKLGDKDYAKDYWTHSQYKKFIEKEFEIIDAVSCGLFIPKLWSIPTLARIIHPVVEAVMRYITPDLFHEKLYILKKKR